MDMKRQFNKALAFVVGGVMLVVQAGCTDLMDLKSTTEVPYEEFWKTEEDATYALMGAYAHVRGLFDRDYYFDGQSDLCRVRDGSGQLSTSSSIGKGGAYRLGLYFPDPMWGYGARFDNYYKFAYGGVNRVNYVIENVQRMLADGATNESLETVVGEARLLRALIYFRLICLWGDVPYIDWVIHDNEEVAHITRTPIEQVKNHILDDLTYAAAHLPDKAAQVGRMAKPAALALRGKVQLYWASWNKNGWPELDGFVPSAEKAREAYAAAAADLKAVIDDYGLDLFRSGAPGNWGKMGEADELPNYFQMFLPTSIDEDVAGEFVLYFTHGGPGTGQSEALMRDFGGRNVGNSQAWVSPTYQVADRYQSTLTGDYCDPLIPMNPSSNPAARTAKNSALNPESYANRDYRMKSTLLWDYEKIMGISSAGTEDGWVVFIFKQGGSSVTIDGKTYPTLRTDEEPYGYLFRKFLRNYGGAKREEGDMAWPVIRLADVYLMYAEADNELNGPQPEAIRLVNRVRGRGNLPALSGEKTSSKDAFFKAIEQERVVELIAEGQRSFDLRRWRKIEEAWGVYPGCSGVSAKDTHGANRQSWFVNPTTRDLERGYIFKIPQSERDRNPKMSQNKPWL